MSTETECHVFRVLGRRVSVTASRSALGGWYCHVYIGDLEAHRPWFASATSRKEALAEGCKWALTRLGSGH